MLQSGEEQEKQGHAPVVLGRVDVARGQDVQGQDVGVDQRLVSFWGVPDPTCKRSTGTHSGVLPGSCDQRGPPIASQLVPRTMMAPWWHTGSSHLIAISLRDVGRIWGGAPMPPQPALLTHNQLPHFLPADQAARLMHQGDGDPPLDTLRPPRPARKGQRLAQSPGSEAGARQGATGTRGGDTWWSRKVPWHGMPPRWSTTAGM